MYQRQSRLLAIAVFILVILTPLPEFQLAGAVYLPNIANLWGVFLFIFFVINLSTSSLLKKKQDFNILPIIFFAGFVVFASLSLVNSVNLDKSFTEFAKILLQFFIYIFMLPNLLKSHRLIRQILLVMIFMGFITSVYGLYEQKMTGSVVITSHPWMEANSYGSGGISSYLAIVAPIAFCWVLYNTDIKIRIISIPVTILIIVTMVGTATRSSILAFTISIIPILWLKYGRYASIKRVLVGVVLFFIFGISSIFIYSQVVLKTRQSISVSSGKTSIESSNLERTLLWNIGLDMFKAHPLLGSGLGTFREHSRHYSALAYDYDAHGVSLKLLAETGLVGFSFFNLFLITVFIQSWATTKRQPNSFVATAIFSALCSTIVHNQFGTRYFFPLFWLIIGLSIAVRLVAFNELPRRKRIRFVHESSLITER